MSMIIYKITNKINGKSYIGQTTQPIGYRWRKHLRKESHCAALRASLIKYGSENFTIEEMCKAESLEQLNLLEQEFIVKFNTLTPNGYNMTTGGFNSSATDEVRLKLSAAKSGQNHPMFGKKLTKEHKARIGSALVGRSMSEKQKIMLSEIFTGRKLSIETKERISKSNMKKIKCNETGVEYESVSEAARSFGVKVASLSNALIGKTKSCKGFTFSYMGIKNV
jgi:group I intron endonuclease